jgi:nucleotide-binding universal stress UspA family protein
MAIIAAVDGDTRPDRVVTVGADLAQAFDTELVVFHAMTEDEFDRRREEREYFVDHAAEDAAKTARWVVTGTLDDPSIAQVEGAVGEPVSEILDLSEELDARYVVVGGRRRTPVGKAVFGSVTQAVLLNAGRPVVTVMTDEE